jgi:hypothetical protein
MHTLLDLRPPSLLDHDVFEALVDEAIEGAVAAWRPPRRAAARPRADAIVDASILEALLDEVLEEIAGHGAPMRPPIPRPACSACRPRCLGCVS